MKHINLYTMGAVLLASLSSCVSEDQPWDVNVSGKGTMSLNVDVLRPQSTRAVSTADFPVTITDLKTNAVVKTYPRAAEVPSAIVLPVGNYRAESHTPGALEKVMSTPYYKGQDEFQILQKINTRSVVTCRMANGSFQMKYSSDFTTAFTSWTISIDDGGQTAISFTEKDGITPAITYMTFDANVTELTVNFKGTTVNGNSVSATNKLTKQQAGETYPTDSPNFSGGDAIVINFQPVASIEGDIVAIKLNANISFQESTGEYPLDVEDKPTTGGGDQGGGGTGGGGDQGGGDTGGGQSADITLNLPADMVIDMTTDPAKGDTYIAAAAGFKSIVVKIISTSPDMVSSLQAMTESYKNLDLINGADLVGNTEFERLFADLQNPISVPKQGEKEYTFPIGKFFMMLAVMPGDHVFDMTVTDLNGATKTGKLKLTVQSM